MKAAIYTPGAGDYYRIDRIASGPEAAIAAGLQGSQQYLACDDSINDADHCIEAATLSYLERDDTPYALDTTRIRANAVDIATLSDLEPDTRITLSGPIDDQFTVTDGSVVFDCGQPGDYRLMIEAPFPYRPVQGVIRGI